MQETVLCATKRCAVTYCLITLATYCLLGYATYCFAPTSPHRVVLSNEERENERWHHSKQSYPPSASQKRVPRPSARSWTPRLSAAAKPPSNRQQNNQQKGYKVSRNRRPCSPKSVPVPPSNGPLRTICSTTMVATRARRHCNGTRPHSVSCAASWQRSVVPRWSGRLMPLISLPGSPTCVKRHPAGGRCVPSARKVMNLLNDPQVY